jgi:tetratricopeptide (TPR) repeat protein
MSDRQTEKVPFSHRLNSFFSRFRAGILVTGIVLVAGIIVAVVISQYIENRSNQAALAAERIVNRWNEWQGAADETDIDEATLSDTEEELRGLISTTIDRFPRSYGALRARFVRAELEWALENWAAAHDAFLAVVDEHPNSHLTAAALFSAAAASENMQQLEVAEVLYQRIVDGEGSPSVHVPRAVFSLGRIAERRGEFDQAIELYNRLLDEHDGSEWTNLGRDRIILLSSRGTDRNE